MPQVFNNAVMTDDGIMLLNKTIAGACKMEITRMVAGSGIYTPDEKTVNALQQASALKAEEQAAGISSLKIQNDVSVIVTAVFNNDSILEEYHINEIGLFAKEKDVEGSEVLYSIAVISGDEGELMPVYNGKNSVQIIQSWAVTVFNAEDVTLALSNDVYALAEDMGQLNNLKTNTKDNLVEAINEVKVATDDKVGKSGNVSSTTAAFIQAETRENIESNEELSTIFGKIAKLFADLEEVAFSGSYTDLADTPTSLPANGGTADKLGTNTVGAANKGIYLNAGVPTAMSGTYGSATKMHYVNAGAYANSTANVGSNTTPVYMVNGVITSTGINLAGVADVAGLAANIAIGANTVQMGNGASASNASSTALGYHASASGISSTALGYYASASGNSSTALGRFTTASGTSSTALGYYATASGSGSTALGYYANASGSNSTALGYYAIVANTATNTIQLGNASSLSTLTCRVAITVTSDIRDKTDITEIDHKAVDFLKKVKAIRYVYNHREMYIDEENLSEEERKKKEEYGLCEYDREAHALGTKKGNRMRVGVSAQNVQQALLEVFGDTGYANIINDNLFDSDPSTIPEDVENQLTANYEAFIPFLIQAVHEIVERLEALEGGITA